MTTNTPKPTNYSPAQVAIIQAASDAATAEGRKLNKDDAARIAADPRMNVDGEPRKARSITAKITNMKLPYAKVVPTTKTGDPVVSKADLVANIERIVDADMEGLDKAPKDVLKALRDFVQRAEQAINALDEREAA